MEAKDHEDVDHSVPKSLLLEIDNFRRSTEAPLSRIYVSNDRINI